MTSWQRTQRDLQTPRRALVAVAAIIALGALGCGVPKPPVAPPVASGTSDPSTHGSGESTPAATGSATATPAGTAPAGTNTVGTPATSGESTSASAVAPNLDAGWYKPVETDFRAEYDRDRNNAAKQSWSDYWSWVKLFYDGNFLAAGWKDQSVKLTEHIKDPQAKAALRTSLNAFGRRVAREWAKSGDVRRINTQDLLELGPKLDQAKHGDDGSGRNIQAAIDALNREIDSRFK